MANELNLVVQQTGLTVTADIYTPGFTLVTGAIACPEIGGATGRYSGSVPAATLSSDVYHIVFSSAGSNIGRGILVWDGDEDQEQEDEQSQFDVWLKHAYADDAVWIDATVANTDTSLGTDGTQDNPVSTIAAATTIANALGIRRFRIIRGDFTLTQAYPRWEFLGIGPAGAGSSITRRINFGGFDHEGSTFERLFVRGDMASPGGIVQLKECAISSVTNARIQADHCGLQGTNSIVNDSFLQNCYSRTAGGSTPIISTNGNDLNLRAYSGGIELRDVTGGAVSAEFVAGQCIIAASCVAGDIQIRGVVSPVTDNSAGATVTQVAAVQGIRLDDIWQNEGLDPVNSKTITENTPGADYDEAVGSISKSVTKVGSVTTIDRA